MGNATIIWNRIRNAAIAVTAATATLLCVAAPAQAASTPNANLDVDLGSGATGYTTEFLYQRGAAQQSLNAVKKWRQDALNDTAVKWEGVTMRQYLAKQGISERDYLSPKWSNALERIAIQRAVEAGSYEDGHTRLNGESCFTASYGDYRSSAEILAWGINGFDSAIDLWASEKEDFVKKTGGVTGHYTTLIDPSYHAYGFGTASSQSWGSVYAGEATSGSNWDQTPTNLWGEHVVQANLSEAKLNQGLSSDLGQTLYIGKTVTPKVTAKVQGDRFTMRGTWSSSNKNVVAVQSNGSLTAKKAGKATLTFTLTNGKKITYAVTAKAQPKNGFVTENGVLRWYENGVMARSHAFYDPASKAWYWADADGSIARDKDVFIPRDESDRSRGGKWVRFDAQRRMVKGEQYSQRYKGWYYFDPVTGEMAKGMRHVPSNGGKWVYYDWTTGKMAHGEQYVNYDAEHTGWYLFDQVTGAMFHGDTFVRSSGGKWVRYDRVTGKMVKGLHRQDNAWYYFDQNTGAMAHGNTWVPEWNAWHYFDQITGRG